MHRRYLNVHLANTLAQKYLRMSYIKRIGSLKPKRARSLLPGVRIPLRILQEDAGAGGQSQAPPDAQRTRSAIKTEMPFKVA